VGLLCLPSSSGSDSLAIFLFRNVLRAHPSIVVFCGALFRNESAFSLVPSSDEPFLCSFPPETHLWKRRYLTLSPSAYFFPESGPPGSFLVGVVFWPFALGGYFPEVQAQCEGGRPSVLTLPSVQESHDVFTLLFDFEKSPKYPPPVLKSSFPKQRLMVVGEKFDSLVTSPSDKPHFVFCGLVKYPSPWTYSRTLNFPRLPVKSRKI